MVNSTVTDLTASAAFDIPINQTGGIIKTACYYAGWGLESTTSAKILDAQISLIDWNATTVNFTLSSTSSTDTFIGFIVFNFIIFNYDYYNQPTVGSFTDGSLTANFGTTNSYQYSNNSNIYNFTTMVGMNDLHC